MVLKYETEEGTAHEALLVHAEGQPGSLVVDRMTGVILTPHMSRPDWSEGLAVALLSEHRTYWTARAGSYTEPQIFDLRDLGWIGVNEEGNEVEIDADIEYRMDILAERYGMDREEGTLGDYMAGMEFSTDHKRTDGEVTALEDAGAELSEDRKQA